MDQAIVYSKNFVDVNTVTGMLGIIEPSHLEALLSYIMAKDTAKVLDFIKMAADYEAEMILDELTLYLKELLLNGKSQFTPLIIERFFRVIAESKSLLSLGSDSEFVLSLALFKMMEALEIKDIDTMIRGLEQELKGVEISEIMVTTPAPDHNIPHEIITITQEEIVATLPVTASKRESIVKESPTVTPLAPEEEMVSNEPEPSTQEAAPVKAEPRVTEPSVPAINPHQKTFDALIKKLYDRDYGLGACFERNISFEDFSDNKLTWGSMAEGEDKKMLITHWGLINMFVKDLFGIETKIVNMPKKKVDTLKVEEPFQEENPFQEEETPVHEDADSASMIEDIEMKSSCIAPEAGETEAAKEKDPSTLLEEPMIKEAIALFDPSKVRIKRNV